MEVLSARLSRLALAIGLAAPLVLAGLYLAAAAAAVRAARLGDGGLGRDRRRRAADRERASMTSSGSCSRGCG